MILIQTTSISPCIQEYRALAEEHLKHDLTDGDRAVLEKAAKKVGVSSLL